MAAPDNVNTLNFSGKFFQSHSLSDDLDKMLALQGVGWATRKAISLATITLRIKHYKDDKGVEHIDVEQTLTGGLTGTPELRTLDWTPRKVDNNLFGAVIAKSRRISVADITDEYLKQGWLPDVFRDGAIEAPAESDKEKNPYTWESNMIWGFEDIKGERRYTRRIRFTGPKGEDITARVVYDYGTSPAFWAFKSLTVTG